MIAGSNSIFGKIAASGWKYTLVPVPRAAPSFFRGPAGLPCLNRISHNPPSRFTVAISSFDSALTTLAPTPWRPPAVLFDGDRRTVGVERHPDVGGVAVHRLVDAVVHNFPDEVMQAGRADAANVHARP